MCLFNPILDKYPDEFLSHVCTFYPLTWDTIEKYKYDFTSSRHDPLGSGNLWTCLSRNIQLDWNFEKILQYEYFWDWRYLDDNDSDKFRWDFHTIEAVKPRIDVSDLIYNDHYGKYIHLTEELIQKYHKKKLEIYETHPDCDPSWVEKYNVKIKPAFVYREVSTSYVLTPLDPSLIYDLDGYMKYKYDSYTQ